MSENLQKLLKEAFLNNSFDYDSMHDSLKKTWMNSYSYLYALQKAYVEYEELFYFSNDDVSHNSELIGKLYLDKMIYANFDVEYDLIHVYSREKFRTSRFYLETFTSEDIMSNPDIFLKIPIIIIDDQVIWDYKMKVTKDCTTFILPFRRQFVVDNNRNPENDEIVYVDHKIQVLVVDNIYYQRITMNKSNMYLNAITKTFKIDKGLLNKIPKQDGTMMCSIHYPNNNGKGYELGTAMIPLEDDGEGFYVASLTDDLNVQMFKSSTDFYVSLFFINRLYQHTMYDNTKILKATTKGAPLMVIQESEMVPYKTPIPIEDFMVFKRSADQQGFILSKNTDSLKMYYPNIYQINDKSMGVGDEYKIYYFYYNAYDLQYTVLFDFYFRFLLDTFQNQSIEKVINDIYYDKADYGSYSSEQIEDFKTSFKKIMNYQYYNHQYGEIDFLNRYLIETGNEDKEPIEYKDETLRKWMKVQPWVLQDYVLDQKKLGSSYHLFTNTLDLTTRLRNNTSEEIGHDTYDFKEPRYVFALENNRDYPALLDLRVFVDGMMVVDLYQERRLFMDYIYIPADMVTADSYIEVEIFPNYSFSEEYTFESMDDSHEVTILEPEENIYPTIADVYHVNNDNIEERFDTHFFDITEHYDRGDITVESNDIDKPIKFTRISRFNIKPNDETVVGVPLTLNFNKCPKGMLVQVTEDGYPYIQIIENTFNFNDEYIRVFRDGRLIPKCKYVFQSSYNCPRILFLDWFKAGEIIYIDITPYRYREVYYQEEISQDTTLIDLRTIINKPFDIRYYDVYMNGRKLSLNNVFSITPWEITLVNLHSNYNLTIYERERDWEYFGLDYKEHLYYFNLDDLFNESYMTEDEKNKIIKDIIDDAKDDRLTINPNENVEEKQDMSDIEKYAVVHIFYYYELIPKTYVNPDRLEFSKQLLTDDYNQIISTYERTPFKEARGLVEFERKMNYGSALLLDPDVYIKGENKDHTQYVYPVGHLDEVSEEYLKQNVYIPPAGNIK